MSMQLPREGVKLSKGKSSGRDMASRPAMVINDASEPLICLMTSLAMQSLNGNPDGVCRVGR